MSTTQISNAFHWRTDNHAAMSCVIADDTSMRTPVYNQWLARKHAYPDSTVDWTEWRAQHEAEQKRPADKRQPGGFATKNGTIPGMGREAKLLAAKPAARAVMSSAQGMPPPKPLHIARAPRPLDKGRHGGAYSKAGTQGGSSKIHKPARRAKVAA